MKKVPDISTRDSRAVLGWFNTFPGVSRVLLELTSNSGVVLFSAVLSQEVRGWSLKIWKTDKCKDVQIYSYGYHKKKKREREDVFYLGKLHKGLVDEDEGDEKGEDLLREAGNETHQEASLEGHRNHHDQYQPKPDPYPARQVLHSIGRTELPRIRRD